MKPDFEGIDADLQAAKRDGFLRVGVEGLSRLVWQVRKSHAIAKRAGWKERLRACQEHLNERMPR
jgi:hypothetical protein